MNAQNDPFISDAYRNDYLNCSRSELQETDNAIRMCPENASDRKGKVKIRLTSCAAENKIYSDIDI